MNFILLFKIKLVFLENYFFISALLIIQLHPLTLCAFRCCPSTASVTSVKVSACNSWSKTDRRLLWWLFHRRQKR